MKVLKYLLCVMLVIMTACAKETPEPVLEAKENGIYGATGYTTDEIIIAYNQLGEAIEEGDETKIVKAIATSFAFEFFTFYNKPGEGTVGGMQYVPQDKLQECKEYFIFYFYKNYTTLKNQYGEENLPYVKEVVAVDPIVTTFEDDTHGTLKAYDVRLALTYHDTTIPSSSLKTDTVITVAEYDGRWSVVQIQ